MEQDIKHIAMKIFHSYEDYYLDKPKRRIFEDLFDAYLSKVDATGDMEVYEAVIKLAREHPADFDYLIKTLREHSLLSE